MVRMARLGTGLEQCSCDGGGAVHVVPCREIQDGVGLHRHLGELLELSKRHLWRKGQERGVYTLYLREILRRKWGNDL